MRLFAIRHKPSGRLMPAVKGRGSTGLNFHIDGFEHEFARHKLRKEPRLFVAELAARRALAAWLMGEWTRYTKGGSSMLGDDYDEYSGPPDKPPSDRKPEEFEVVAFNLVPVRKKD